MRKRNLARSDPSSVLRYDRKLPIIHDVFYKIFMHVLFAFGFHFHGVLVFL